LKFYGRLIGSAQFWCSWKNHRIRGRERDGYVHFVRRMRREKIDESLRYTTRVENGGYGLCLGFNFVSKVYKKCQKWHEGLKIMELLDNCLVDMRYTD